MVKDLKFMTFFRLVLFLGFLSIVISSCSVPYYGKDLYGAEEFVLDSYKIREGKFSVLEMEGKPFEELPENYLCEYKDTIQDDDALYIVLYHPKRTDLISTVQNISAQVGYMVTEGKIHLPDLHPIEVKGLTLQEAARKIQRCYLQEIDDIEAFVTYKVRNVKKVELAGLVQTPSIPINGKIRLFDILSQARVPPNANLFKSYFVRDGKPIAVDFYKLIKEGDMSQNIVMRGGDKVYIAEPSASTVMVMGEVNVQKVVDVPNGFISLRKALATAQGIPFTGDKSYIQIIRGNIVRPKVYTLSWQHVLHLPNDSLLLMPGDIVYVASKPITEWNRFISQLLPSFTTIDVIGNSCRGMGVFVP